MWDRRASEACRRQRARFVLTPSAASPVASLSSSAPPSPRVPCSAPGFSNYPYTLDCHAYASDDLLDALLVALHLQEGLDLADGQVLPVAQGDQLIKGTEQLVGISEDLALIKALAGAGDDLGKEVEGIDVLEDVGLFVGNEDHVELVQWLVDKANIVLFDRGMLGTTVGELGKGEKEGLESRTAHLVERPGQDGLAASGADRSCEDNHLVCCSWCMWLSR